MAKKKKTLAQQYDEQVRRIEKPLQQLADEGYDIVSEWDSIPVTDETLKNEIIEYALRRIGSTRIGLLDGMTLIYHDRWYNIYATNVEVTVEEV